MTDTNKETKTNDEPNRNSDREILRLKSVRQIFIGILIMAGCMEVGFAILNISAMPWFLYDHVFKQSSYAATAMTLTVSAYLVTEALLKSPMGHLSDKYGRKFFMLAGPVICIFTSLLTVLIGHYAVENHMPMWIAGTLFAILRGIDGIGVAMLWPAAYALLSEIHPARERSSAMSLINVTYMVGLAIGPFVGGFVNDTFKSPYASFYTSAVLFVATVIIGLIALPTHSFIKQISIDEYTSDQIEEKFHFRDVFECSKKIPGIIILSILTFFGIGMVMFLIKVYAMTKLGISETGFGQLVMVPAIIMAIVSIPIGKLSDYMGRRISVQIGIGGCALGMWGVLLFQHPISLMISGSLIGLGFIIALPSWFAAVSEIDSRRRGGMLGAVMTAQGVGAILGIPLGGLLYSHIQNAPFIGCASILTISCILSGFIMNTKVNRKELV